MNRVGRWRGWARWFVTAAVAVATTGTAWAQQASPDDLVRLVPPSVVVCVRARNLGRLWKDAREGALVQRLKATKVWQDFAASDDYLKMTNARGALMARYQLDIEQAILDTIGKEVILTMALEAHPDGSLRRFFYLLAGRATSAERLKAVADSIRTVRTDTGELKSSVGHDYRGYVIHEEVSVPKHGPHAGSERTAFYCLAGDLLLAGERIGPVKAAIDRVLDPGKPSLADADDYQQAMRMVPADCAVTAYVAGPALTGKGEWTEQPPEAGKRPVLRGLRERVWGAVGKADAVAVGLRTEPALQVKVRTRLNPEKLGPQAAALVQERAAAHAAWSVMPARTVAAFSLRTDIAALVGLLRDHAMGPAAAERYDHLAGGLSAALGGLDFQKEVLTQLGPEAALVVSRQPLPDGPGDGRTVRGLAATLLIQAGAAGEVDARLLAALGMYAWVAVASNNRNPAKPRLVAGVERVGEVPVTYVDFAQDHPLKGTLSPCCAKVGPFVAVSTSRRALAEIIAAAGGGPSLARTDAFERHLQALGGKADSLLYLDAQQLAAALDENRGALLARRKTDKPDEEARRGLAALVELLRLVEAVSVARTNTPEGASATIMVTGLPAPAP